MADQLLDEPQWSRSVRAASSAADRVELKRLFDLAVSAWGRERTSALWFHLMSESDSNAQTG